MLEKIECQICKAQLKQINHLHLRKHKISVQEYKDKFPDAPINSPESQKARSNSLKGRKITWANKISESVKGSWKENRFQGRTGIPLSEESRKIVSEKLKGHEVSEETKIKIGLSGIGRKPWNSGLTKEDDERLMSVSDKIKIWNKENMTDEKKYKISQTLKRKYADGMKIPQAKGSFRKDLNNYFRSTWEANYARILNHEKKSWTYEEHKFPFYNDDGSLICVYTPDFYVDGELIEIKGHADSNFEWKCDCKRCERDKLKMSLFLEQYSDKVLVFIGTKEYKELVLKYSNIIPEWEK